MRHILLHGVRKVGHFRTSIWCMLDDGHAGMGPQLGRALHTLGCASKSLVRLLHCAKKCQNLKYSCIELVCAPLGMPNC